MSNPAIPMTVNWKTLPDTDARAQWEALTTWTRWLVDRYGLPVGVVPTCWIAHPPLVEELSALHTAWTAAYVPATRSPTAGVEWHHQFDQARRRMTHWATTNAGGCSGGRTHTAPTPPPHWNAELQAATIAADCATR